VVLSACETGLGDIQGDEGVYGLQRAFALAGAEQMIMSLWKVPDRYTAELMQLFYTSLLNGVSPLESLRKAQLELAKKTGPYNWAAFVLVQ
jgi:CHAT domain-containing protein